MIRYPDKVKKGDTIGVTAVSSLANSKKIDYAEDNLKELGFEILETDNVRTGSKLVSSSGETRANELMQLWKDNKVSHIISARGGEFLMEMLPYLHEYKEELNRLPCKWVQGYSDVSLLNFYLTTNCNIATVHAQNISDYAMENLHYSLTNTLDIVGEGENTTFIQTNFEKYIDGYLDDSQAEYNLKNIVKYKNINDNKNEKFSGRIIGGCVGVLRMALGTKYDNTKKFCKQFNEGIIWYLENCELSVCDLYRSLWQMQEAGWFDNAKGFLIGRTYSSETVEDFTYIDALEKSIGKLNVPIIYDVDVGHVPPQLTIINGSYAEFEFDNEKGKLTQKLI